MSLRRARVAAGDRRETCRGRAEDELPPDVPGTVVDAPDVPSTGVDAPDVPGTGVDALAELENGA